MRDGWKPMEAAPGSVFSDGKSITTARRNRPRAPSSRAIPTFSAIITRATLYGTRCARTPSRIQPVIVVRKKSRHAGRHSGAWKVAYADFVTAMMSLFIVLWLMNSSEQVRKAVAGYFNDPGAEGPGSTLKAD